MVRHNRGSCAPSFADAHGGRYYGVRVDTSARLQAVLLSEARWIGNALASLPPESFPLLNLGSSTLRFRREEQPYVEQKIFDPLRRAGMSVVHTDVKEAEGVDAVLNFLDPTDQVALRALGARSILCSNLLEHLAVSADQALREITSLLPLAGHLILTVPHKYPYHPDPIDNGFRPGPTELAGLLPAVMTVLNTADVKCRRLAYYEADHGHAWPRFVARLATPFVRPAEWWKLVTTAGIQPRAACLIAQRTT